MAHSYQINLDLTASSKSQQSIAKLNKAFEEGGGTIDEMNKAFAALADQVEDVRDLEKAYNSNVKKTLVAKDKELETLNKQQALLEDINSEEYKQLSAKIKELETQKAQIKSDSLRYRTAVKEAKIRKQIAAQTATAADDVAEQVKGYKKLSKTLETIKTQFQKIQKIGSKVGTFAKGAAGKVGAAAGMVGKLGAGVAGVASIAGGAVIASAGEAAEKERALSALKGDERETADRVFISTGADYSTIVNAINKLSAKFSGDELAAAAIQEVQNPGFASLLMASGGVGVSPDKLAGVMQQIKKASGSQDLSAAMEASTKARAVTRGAVSQTEYLQAYAALQNTGLDDERINAIISSVARKGGNFIEQFNKTDLAQYVRGQQKAQVQVVKLSQIDPTKSAEKSSAQRMQESLNRLQLLKDKIILQALPPLVDVVEDVLDSPAFDMLLTGAKDLTVRVMPLISQTLKAIMPTIQKILPPLIQALEAMVPPLSRFLVWALDKLAPIVSTAADVLSWIYSGRMVEDIAAGWGEIWDGIKEGLGDIVDGITSTIKKAFETVKSWISEKINALISMIRDVISAIKAPLESVGSAISEKAGAAVDWVADKLPWNAQGGIVSTPSIVGEAGREMVLPLNNPARAQSIVNNYTMNQSFNLSGAQSPLSLAQALENGRFVRRVKWA